MVTTSYETTCTSLRGYFNKRNTPKLKEQVQFFRITTVWVETYGLEDVLVRFVIDSVSEREVHSVVLAFTCPDILQRENTRTTVKRENMRTTVKRKKQQHENCKIKSSGGAVTNPS